RDAGVDDDDYALAPAPIESFTYKKKLYEFSALIMRGENSPSLLK
ncbi:hypothetical protein C5167_031382, partial [Papaver somniferum]